MYCSCGKPSENVLRGGDCASCAQAKRRQARIDARPKKQFKALNRVSGKMKKWLSEYSREKAKWIKGRFCAVLPGRPADDIHHMKGRVGYADAEARAKGIPLLLDKRFWLAVSRSGHTKITNDSAWAIEKGYSLPRNEIIND